MGAHSRPRKVHPIASWASRRRPIYKKRSGLQRPVMRQLFDRQAKALFTTLGVVLVAGTIAAATGEVPQPRVIAAQPMPPFLPPQLDPLPRVAQSAPASTRITSPTLPGFRVPTLAGSTDVSAEVERAIEQTQVLPRVEKKRTEKKIDRKDWKPRPKHKKEGHHHDRPDQGPEPAPEPDPEPDPRPDPGEDHEDEHPRPGHGKHHRDDDGGSDSGSEGEHSGSVAHGSGGDSVRSGGDSDSGDG